MAKVFHSEIFGLRDHKYEWLKKHNIKNVKWKRIYPGPEFYLFIPTDNKLANRYNSFYPIDEIFPINSVGIVTARDNFVIDFDKKKLERRIEQFIDTRFDTEILKQTHNLTENQSWKISEQREKLKNLSNWKDYITKILYRPFDERFIFYHDEMIERPRKDVMKHMLKKNIALITSRIVKGKDFHHCFITDKITDAALLAQNTASSSYIIPLYTFKDTKSKPQSHFIQMMLFEPVLEYENYQPNIDKNIFNELKNIYNKNISPEDIFYYTYAVLYSNIYRTKYAEFLKIDFPRIPFTKDYKTFTQLNKIGKHLTELHLLKSDELNSKKIKFPVAGNNRIEKVVYKDKKVWINSEQFFEEINDFVWNYTIGGYQVCDKWLKDRKENVLNLDDIQRYMNIVLSLEKTIEIQKSIDRYYNSVENSI